MVKNPGTSLNLVGPRCKLASTSFCHTASVSDTPRLMLRWICAYNKPAAQEAERPKLLNVGMRGGVVGNGVKRLNQETPDRRSPSVPSGSDVSIVNKDPPSEPSSRSTSPEEVDEPDDPLPPSSRDDLPSPSSHDDSPPPSSHNEPLPSTDHRDAPNTLTFDEERDMQIIQNKRMLQELGLDKMSFGKPKPRRPSRKQQPQLEEESGENDVSPCKSTGASLDPNAHQQTHSFLNSFAPG